MQHETIAKGIAIGTVPATGTSLDPNSDITLNISEGPSAITIPADLPGRTEAAARDVLRQKGLAGAPGTTMANSPTVPAGIVITTKPAPGQNVAVGSIVEIIVSTGKVVVPQLVGLPQAEAEAALKELGLGMTPRKSKTPRSNRARSPDSATPRRPSWNRARRSRVTVAKAPPPPAAEPHPHAHADPDVHQGSQGRLSVSGRA